MNRREFLQCAAALTAGATAFPSQWVMSEEQSQFLVSRRNYVDQAEPRYFTSEQRATISAIADQVIPATDTPGALAAGTPRFIELMVSDWFNDDEQAHFMTGLASLQLRAGAPFDQLTPAKQLALLETLEAESDDAAWFQMANTIRVWDDTAPFICQIKELTVLGFMLSEVGGTQFLRMNPMGGLDGDIELAPQDPAYAADLPARGFEI